jgi:hypothetical protein
MQEILVYMALAAALVYLVKRFFIKKKKSENGCDSDCGC